MSISAAAWAFPIATSNEPPPLPDAYAEVVKRTMRDLGCRLIFEPGRLLVGNAGILVTQVLFVKHGEAKNFIVVDAAMNDLIRPTLYDAYHEIRPVREQPAAASRIRADVVGPVCESGDFLAHDREMPEPKAGDLLAVMSAGAYGAVQAGTYNTRAAGAGSAGERGGMGRRPPAPRGRPAYCPRSPAGLALNGLHSRSGDRGGSAMRQMVPP